MATSYVFNPFTSNFDQISTITLANVGTVPNAQAATLTGQVLALQPADASFPGVISTTTQSIAGAKFFTTYLQVGGTALTQAVVQPSSNLCLVGSFVTSVSYGGSTPTVIGYKANGTEAVPTATTTGQIMNAITARGHSGVGFIQATKGRYTISAAETWTPTANGTFLTMLTTPIGATGLLERMRITDAGFVGINTTAPSERLNVVGNGLFTGTLTASNLSGTNTGDVTLAAVGAVPNANAASLSGQVLTIQPASASFPGVVTTATQSFAGDKTFTGNIAAANLSGTNTGDQTITLTGDVTGSGNGSFAATIANDAVTNAKLADMPTLTIKGNNTGGVAGPTDLTVSQVNTMLGTIVNPMTTQGDVIYGGVSGLPTRLGIGTGNQVLMAQGNSTTPSWRGVYQAPAPNYIAANPNFEVNTAGWVTYANTAQPTPVTGTGGSPTITLSASSSSPLRGVNSGVIAKTAANSQGEGVSYDFAIDSADTSSTLTVSFNYSCGTNFVAGGSSDITVWVYDITNATLIQLNPFNIDFTNGWFIGTFLATTSTSYRLILHIATTNALAWDFKIDNFFVGAIESNFAATTTPWIATPGFTVTGVGTIATTSYWSRQVGDTMQFRGYFTSGTVAASTMAVVLPPQYVIDSSKFGTGVNLQQVGMIGRLRSGSDNTSSTTSGPFPLFYDGSTTTSVFVAANVGSNQFTKTDGNTFTTGDVFEFLFEVPIVGLFAALPSANGRTFLISNVLASGTRITGTPPTVLGEYRTFLQGPGNAFTETLAAPSVAPSAVNGMSLDANRLLSAADASNFPGRYDIFVGTGKYVKPVFYLNSGRTGFVDASPKADSVNAYGFVWNYDPATGVFSIEQNLTGPSSITTVQAGRQQDYTVATSVFFDVVVSENAIAVTVEPASAQNANLVLAGPTTGSPATPAFRSLVTDDISGGMITRPKLASLGQQLSSSSGFFFTSSTTPIDVMNLTVTITTTGRPVMLLLVGDTAGVSYVNSHNLTPGTITVAIVAVVRASTTIQTIVLTNSQTTSGSFQNAYPPSAFSYVDPIAAGTYTYKIQTAVNTAGDEITFSSVRLLAYEIG